MKFFKFVYQYFTCETIHRLQSQQIHNISEYNDQLLSSIKQILLSKADTSYLYFLYNAYI